VDAATLQRLFYRGLPPAVVQTVEYYGASESATGYANTLAFTEAILQSTEGGTRPATLLARADTYRIDYQMLDPYTGNDGLAVPILSFCTLLGNGRTRIIEEQPQTAPFHAAGVHSFRISGFMIENACPSAANGMKIVDCHHFTIDRCSNTGGYIGFALIGCRDWSLYRLSVPLMDYDVYETRGISIVDFSYTNLLGEFKVYAGTSNGQVVDCDASGAHHGIVVWDQYGTPGDVPGVTIKNFKGLRNRVHGALIWSTNRTRIIGGDFSENGNTGIMFDQAVSPLVDGATVERNAVLGIDACGTSDLRITNHTRVQDNSRQMSGRFPGVWLRQSGRPNPTTNTVIEDIDTGNTMSGGQGWGVYAYDDEALGTHLYRGTYEDNRTAAYYLNPTGMYHPA
jgi:hypothetical protein